MLKEARGTTRPRTTDHRTTRPNIQHPTSNVEGGGRTEGGHLKGSVHENVMFPPGDVRLSERVETGPGKSDRWRTSRVTEGVNLSSHAHRLSAIGTSRRLDGSGALLALLQETRSLDCGPLPALSPRTPPLGTAHPAAVSSFPTAPERTPRGKS
jgi:hypothetical protein